MKRYSWTLSLILSAVAMSPAFAEDYSFCDARVPVIDGSARGASLTRVLGDESQNGYQSWIVCGSVDGNYFKLVPDYRNLSVSDELCAQILSATGKPKKKSHVIEVSIEGDQVTGVNVTTAKCGK